MSVVSAIAQFLRKPHVSSGGPVFLGGDFTTVSGTTRNRAAAVDSDVTQADPTVHPWNPDCANIVETMVVA